MRVATASQIAEIDRRTIEEFGIPASTLMERAGQAIAAAAMSMRATSVLREFVSRYFWPRRSQNFPAKLAGPLRRRGGTPSLLAPFVILTPIESSATPRLLSMRSLEPDFEVKPGARRPN